jgi:tetratricopeptide (TPR) repeat protein
MLGDVLLESGQAQEALREYQQALRLSPARFNGLFNAGQAAEAAGDKPLALSYYTALLESTDNGSRSTRRELVHAKSVVADAKVAAD